VRLDYNTFTSQENVYNHYTIALSLTHTGSTSLLNASNPSSGVIRAVQLHVEHIVTSKSGQLCVPIILPGLTRASITSH